VNKTKTYAIRKAGIGWQVVWFFAGGFTVTGYKNPENDVEDGYFRQLKDAENHANSLEFFGEGQ
jgi:hypothetical protein